MADLYCQGTYPTAKEQEDQKIEGTKIAWLSLSIAFVLDTEDRIILTGGTQPTCHDSPIFEKAIKHLREEFAEQRTM
jgi:hypothetical protein